jgi:isoaspartyl peptidase/L-asparaginase-like protein (Ntn-hydrolase superfamily)
MNHDCWTPRREIGFLVNPDPISDIAKCDSPLDSGISEQLQSLAVALPTLIADGRLRSTMDKLPVFDNDELVTPAMRTYYEAFRTDGPNDTVGAIAIDSDGNVAAATSTSGTPRKPVGRVGDSPVFGAGGYAENGIGAAGATGQGEQIMRLMLSKVACDALSSGMSATEAANLAAGKFEQKFQNSMSGIIVIDRNGSIGSAQTAPKMAFGWISNDGLCRSVHHFS